VKTPEPAPGWGGGGWTFPLSIRPFENPIWTGWIWPEPCQPWPQTHPICFSPV
jgi:hypothetical protein